MSQTIPGIEVPEVPETSVGPKIPSSGYLVEHIKNGVHWITDGGYQSAFVVGDEQVIAIDAPPSLGGLVTKAIRDVTDKPITHVIYTHYHGDHIGNTDQFPDDAIRIANQQTYDLLVELGDAKRRLPDVTYKDDYRLEVGGQVIDLSYKGPNHSPDNGFIHFPQADTLMFVDVFYPGWVPFANIAMSKHIPGFMNHHDHALAFDFETLIPGHITRLGTREDIAVQREYMNDIRDAAQHALEITHAKREISASTVGKGHIYTYFKTMYDMAAAEAAQPVIQKWEGRLGGVETFAVNHTFIMYQSMRLDDNIGPHVVFLPGEDEDGSREYESTAAHDHDHDH